MKELLDKQTNQKVTGFRVSPTHWFITFDGKNFVRKTTKDIEKHFVLTK